MSAETEYPKENKNNEEKNIFLMNDEERIKYIYDVITHDSHYSDASLDFDTYSKYINETFRNYMIHNKKSPIVTRFGEAIYFEPAQKYIDADGFNEAYIKYATHFISGHVKNEVEKDIRAFDRSKFSSIEFLVPSLISPDVLRLRQKDSKEKNRKEGIVYVKEMKIDKIKCIVLVAETTQKGEVRSITFFPKRQCGYVEKQKALGEWFDAPLITRPIGRNSPSDETQTMSIGGNVRHDSNTKSNKKKHTNNYLSLELYDTNTHKVVIKYDIIDNQIIVEGKILTCDELYRLFLKRTNRMGMGGMIDSISSFLNQRFIPKDFLN